MSNASTRLICAQRLAASQEKSPGTLSKLAKRPTSAQRLAASQEKSRLHARLRPLSPAVLNASRHHRKNRARDGRDRLRAAEVLNASPNHRKTGHQPRWNDECRFECSPPRGITGKIAVESLLATERCLVLNASRHHRKNRWKDNHRGDASCPVLNASRHHRKNRITERWRYTLKAQCSTPRGITGKIAANTAASSRSQVACSTPRGITGKIDVDNWCVNNVLPSVLTASPHQRKNPQHPPNFSLAMWPVLNASRHHRKNRIAPCASLHPNCEVLNASRHHRKNRRRPDVFTTPAPKCSTPRGITGKIANSAYENADRSKACSTPRGITGKIARVDRASTTQPSHAQRLH